MASDNKLNIDIAINVDSVQKVVALGGSLSGTADAAGALGEQSAGAAGGLDELAGGAGKAADDTGALGDALTGAVDAAGTLGKQSADTASNADALDAALAAAAASAQTLGGETDGAVPRVGNLQGAMAALGVVSDEALKKTAETARIAYEQLKASGTASARELEDAFKVYAERAIAANGGVATEAIKVEAAMRGLQVQTDSAGNVIVTSMGAAEKATGGFLDSMRGKLTAIAAAVTSYFTVDFFAGAISGSGDFEQALDRVQSATNATAAEMALLRKAAEESGVDSIAAAGALENLAKAGLSAKDAIGALPAVISLAKAGDVGMAESAEFLTKAVMGMGLAFSDAGRVADVLAAGANATNTSVKGLAEGLSYAAPVAQSLGLSLETTVAIIGKFADAGIDASRAGTALNSVLSQFGDPASKFRGELAAAGITTGNFETALHQLAAAGPRGAKAINAVGQEAGPALRALLNQGMPALDELVKKLGSAEGAAASAAAVMDANLNGAMAGLGVAWKYVKDTLGTPVLPVITSAVNDLTAALRGAVQDGTVGKFGEALAAGFQSGIKWARDFLAQVNFNQVSADLRVFADKTGAVFVQIGEYASTAGNTVKLVYGVMSAGTNTVLGGVYLIGEAFAGVASNIMSGVAVLRDGLAKVTFGGLSESFKLAADDARNAAQGFWEASEAMAGKSSAAFAQVAESSQLARDGFTGLAGAATGAQPAVDASAQAIGEMAKQLEAAAEKNAAARKATEDKKAADEAAAVALSQLNAEYAALVSGGNLQAAAEKLQEINKVMQAAPAASADAIKAAQEAAQAIADAFQRLGVTSSADLKLQADNAQRDYNIIKSAGSSTAADIANAFRKSAEAAIAANGGIAPSWVTAEAAARGYEVQVDSAGKATLRTAEAAAAGVDALAQSYENAGQAAKESAEAAEDARKKQEESTSLNGRRDPVDASGGFVLREKARKGTLSADDLAIAEANLLSSEANQRMYEKNAGFFSNDGAKSIFQELNSATDIYKKVKALADAQSVKPESAPVSAPVSAPAPAAYAPAPAAPAPTYITQITLPSGGTQKVRMQDADSQSIVNDLVRQLAAARGTASR